VREARGHDIGLFVAFIAAQVWGDLDRAHAAVNREASALRAIVLLAAAFPGEPETRLRALVHRQIEDAVTQEWPAMASGRATLTVISAPLISAHGRPFTGTISVGPDVLLQVLPDAPALKR
jgi:hypothetical protein